MFPCSAATAIASCFLLCLLAGSEQLSLTEFAVPTAVEAGASAELQCRYSLGAGESDAGLFVKWWWTPLGSTTEFRKSIYQRIRGREPQHAASDNIQIKENDTIELLNLQPVNSGTYECEVSDIASEVHRQQQLIVYTKGSGPQMNISTVADGPDEDEDEDVLVSCEARGVAPQPELAITVDGEMVSIAELVTAPDEGLYSVSANATISKEKAVGAEVRCELFFKNENISHPAFIDSEIYQSGGAQVATDAPELTTQPDAELGSLQNLKGGSSRLHSSWKVFFAVAILLTLH